MNKLQTLFSQNKHTSVSGIAYFSAKVLAQLANLWFPGHEDKVKTTLEIVEAAAVGYGLISAGDAQTSTKQTQDLQAKVALAVQTGNTDLLKKSDVPKAGS